MSAFLGVDIGTSSSKGVLVDEAGRLLATATREHAVRPDVWRRARRLFMPASWLLFRLTGAYALDYQSASQCTPLFDTHALDWFAPWTARLARRAGYDELYALFRQLYPATRTIAHTLAARQRQHSEGTR